MKKLRLLAVLACISTLGAVPASAGHLFTQGETNTPVWLQEGQAVYVEQFYSNEYDSEPGNFAVNFHDDSYFTDPNYVAPTAADTTDVDWYKWSAGDVVEVKIQTATGSMTWTAAYDEADTCAYTICGFGFDSSSGYSTLSGDQIPAYTAWGTFLPSIDTAVVTSGGGLDIGEINTLGASGMESLSPYFFGAAGTDDPAVAFAAADANTDGVISDEEMGAFVWSESQDVFDALVTANPDADPTGALNGFGILFTALQGDFALTGYRIADSMGLQLHGSGSGPVDQSSICTPPNCGPAASAVTEVGTSDSVYRTTVVVDQALRQATQILVGAAEQEVDVNFTESAPAASDASGVSVSTSGSPIEYRWAGRAEGAFDSNDDLGKTRSGSFVVAYGLNEDLDVGVYGNRRNLDLDFGGFGFEGNMTSIGAYLRKRPDDGKGLQWKLSIGGATGKADISRAAGIEGAEAGVGSTDIDGKVAAFELAYGNALGDTLLTSYSRVTFSDMGRDGYTETSSVTAPVTYDAYKQTLTTLTLGMNADRRVAERVRMTGGVYAVRDLSRSADALGGSAALGGLDSFSVAAPVATNPTRVGADVTVFFDVGNNSRVYTRAGAQGAANSDKATYSFALGFETRF